MRYSLINPGWTFDGSIYFGCQEPHLPLEFGYSRALLERAGHVVDIVDAQLHRLSLAEIRARVSSFQPDFTVIATAPSYLFWRCPPPELRVPAALARELRDIAGTLIAVGPHGSTTPAAALRKIGTDAVILGECEEVLPEMAGDWSDLRSIAYNDGDEMRIHPGQRAADMTDLPVLQWEPSDLLQHTHHHHRFDRQPDGPGAEMETSRGCPYHCTFCAKDNFRNGFRRRPVETVAAELDGLIASGAVYVYFIDEIFLPYKDVLEAIAARGIPFGIQTRIDLWKPDMIDLLGRAGCVSIEAGVESITEAGRELLDKKCRLSTDEITERLVLARERVPFVQANLLDSRDDDPAEVQAWRTRVRAHGIWANDPVPLFPYPGSPDYTRRWGVPDDAAWERAHEAYLGRFTAFSDIQDQQPLPLIQLESYESRHA